MDICLLDIFNLHIGPRNLKFVSWMWKSLIQFIGNRSFSFVGWKLKFSFLKFPKFVRCGKSSFVGLLLFDMG